MNQVRFYDERGQVKDAREMSTTPHVGENVRIDEQLYVCCSVTHVIEGQEIYIEAHIAKREHVRRFLGGTS